MLAAMSLSSNEADSRAKCPDLGGILSADGRRETCQPWALARPTIQLLQASPSEPGAGLRICDWH